MSLYQNGPFTDLCRGPHGPGTKRIKAVKLTSVAGAYWRGDSNRPMLTRIYGTAFFSKDAARRSTCSGSRRRRRATTASSAASSACSTWDPVSPGLDVLDARRAPCSSTSSSRSTGEMQEERGYVEVKTPQLYESTLWETSGHWGKYKENIFVTQLRGARVRLQADELPGPLQALQPAALELPRPAVPLRRAGPAAPPRAVGDAARPAARAPLHPGRRPRLLPRGPGRRRRSRRCMAFAHDIYEMFGFPVHVELSTRPGARTSAWATTRSGTRPRACCDEALEAGGHEYTIAEGEGAFYAPKIDLHMTDSLGRSWQLGTVQLDYNLPERFGLTYTGADNAEHMPVMIHRALFGSFERFIGILLEHTAGELPFWLAPVQASVLPIADDQIEYARRGRRSSCATAGLRVEVDDRTESIGKKIRNAELQKIPYMLVVGDKAEGGEVGVRRHREGDVGVDGVCGRRCSRSRYRGGHDLRRLGGTTIRAPVVYPYRPWSPEMV